MKLFRNPIALEDGSWIGAFAKVCPGLAIGQGAILTVGSVATKSVPPRQIWAGNPARYLRDRSIGS
jgi:putative colanic acid biosynthesis acetyltransferase WcaF